MQMCALLCAEHELVIWYTLFLIASADRGSFGEGRFIFLQPGTMVTRPTQLYRRSSSYGRGLEIRACWPGQHQGPLPSWLDVVQKCGARADAMQAQQAWDFFCQDSIVAVLEHSVGHGNVGFEYGRCWWIVLKLFLALIMDHRSISSHFASLADD